MLLGLVVFAVVYAALSIPALPRRGERVLARGRLKPWAPRLLARPGIALAGALVVVAAGEVPWRGALAAIDWPTLALLAGMMLLVAALELANAFGVLADHLVRRFRTPARLLVATMLVVAVLSALVLNDAVVLLFTPVLVRAARAMDRSPFPFLAAEAFAANLGSAATPTGNPQNAAIALRFGITFVEFAQAAALVALAGLALGIVACLVAFRRDLAPRADAAPLALPSRERITNRPMLAIALGAIALALLGFVAGPAWGVPLWASALGAGLLALALAPAAKASPVRLARSVDAGVLVFFVGLFVLLETVRNAGILDLAAPFLASSGSFVVTTAVLSNLVSNVPAVLLLMPFAQGDGGAILLAVASTFAGNATFLGSAATVIVAETARAHGASFDVARFTLIGLPLAAATLLLAWLVLG